MSASALSPLAITPTVALIGKPNAGKSSLFNALCGSPAAIVDEQPGTTRDVVTATCMFSGMEITLHDTAGLRSSASPVEREGMRRAQQASDDADLVVQVHDATTPVELLPAQLQVYNKIDLSCQAPHVSTDAVYVSAKLGTGIDLLRAEIVKRLGGAPQQEPRFLARERHAVAIRSALSALTKASHTDTYLEETAEHLRIAHNEISKITGSSAVEDLLKEIFAQFCIGK